MNTNDQLEKKLNELGDAVSPEPCIVEAVMGRIEQFPAPTSRGTNRTRSAGITKPAIGLAACLVLILGAYLASSRRGAEETAAPSTAGDNHSLPAHIMADFNPADLAYVDSKWGFIDETGKVVVEPKYTEAGDFSEGLAAVKTGGSHYLGGKWGFIDRTGKEIAGPLFDRAKPFSEGLAAVRSDGKWGFIGRDGTFRISPQFESVGSFREGLASFGAGKKKGYIDRSGKVVIEPGFQYAGGFSEGLAAVQVNRDGEEGGAGGVLAGYIDATGRMVIELGPQLQYGLGFSEGMAAVIGVNRKWGFIDRDGEPVVPPEYVQVGEFHNGLAEVWIWSEEEGEKWGAIDKAGTVVIEFRYAYNYGIRYSEADGTVKGLYWKGGRVGEVIAEDLDMTRLRVRVRVKDGLIKVWSGGERPVLGTMKYGFIDLMGKVVIKPRLEAAGDFHEGLAMFAVGLRWGLTRSNGTAD